MHGIGINDPVNGVWLPRTKADRDHWATPFSPAHTEIHRFNYETWLITQFQAMGMSAERFSNRLRAIKGQLKNGGYPAQIVSPKDDQWSGA